MARVVKWEPPARAARTKYPWDEWFNGQAWELERGVDFATTIRGMQSTVLTRARRLDIAVATAVVRDENTRGAPARWLYVKAFPGRRYARGRA